MYPPKSQITLRVCISVFNITFGAFISRVVGRLPKFIWKKPMGQIQKNLNNINWYSCHKSSEAGNLGVHWVIWLLGGGGGRGSQKTNIEGGIA